MLMKTRFILVVIATILLIAQSVRTQAQTADPNAEAGFVPKRLIEISGVLGKAIAGKGTPEDTPLGIVANSVTAFWTAAQIGAQRASSEIGAPTIFTAPIKAGDKVVQGNLVKSFVDEGYKGIAISVIDPETITPIMKAGIDKHINFINIDSDAPDSGRRLYIGTDNYNGGFAAGKELVRLLGDKGGSVVGLVGLETAPNAIGRIQGIKDAIKGTKVTLVEVMSDGIDATKALDNAETAIDKYPDLAAFVGIYAFNGPAAGQALRVSGKVGKIKIVAFDMLPETITLVRDGVISTAIVQRPYYWGYLSTYVLYAMSVLGPDETMTLLAPYLDGEKHDILDTKVDVVSTETLADYLTYLESIGIKSQ
jgi:ribose transport system substrate-binding protein